MGRQVGLGRARWGPGPPSPRLLLTVGPTRAVGGRVEAGWGCGQQGHTRVEDISEVWDHVHSSPRQAPGPHSASLAPTTVPSLPPPPCSNHISRVTAAVSTLGGSINLGRR